MFNNYEEFLEESEMTPSTRKTLDRLGSGFENDQEIVKAIIALGLELKPRSYRDRTADYVFYDKETGSIYRSFTSGYVRYNSLPHKSWRGEDVTTRTPIVNYTMDSVTDRLLVILRRALKLRDLYSQWSRSKLNTKEFMETLRPRLLGRKFGI